MNRMERFSPGQAILAVGCAFIWQTHSQRAPAPRRASQHGACGLRARTSGRYDVRIPDEERRVAGMSDYVDSSVCARWVMWAVLDARFTYLTGGQSQGKTIHSPRNCLPGAGWGNSRRGSPQSRSSTAPGMRSISMFKGIEARRWRSRLLLVSGQRDASSRATYIRSSGTCFGTRRLRDARKPADVRVVGGSSPDGSSDRTRAPRRDRTAPIRRPMRSANTMASALMKDVVRAAAWATRRWTGHFSAR